MRGILAVPGLLLYLSHLASEVAADCYSHDGVRATDSKYYNGPELLSCGRGTNNCCLQGERCGSNLLCYNPSNQGSIARQYCADPDWNGCSTLAPKFNAAGVVLKECRNNTVTVGNSCATGTIWFVDPADGAVYNASLKSSTASPTYWSIDSAAIFASATASGSSNSAAASSATATPTSGQGAATASNPSQPANTSSASPSSSGISAGAGAGIGIGAAVAIAAAAVAVWLYIRKRKRQSVLPDQGEKPSELPTGEASYPYTDAHKTVYAHEAQEANAQAPRQELAGYPRSELP